MSPPGIKTPFKTLFAPFSTYFSISYVMSASNIVKVQGTSLIRGEKPYRVVGTNFWHGMNLGAIEGIGNISKHSKQSRGGAFILTRQLDSIEWGGDRKRLDAELDELKELGINMLRIMASSEGEGNEPFRMKPCLMTQPGVYNEELFRGLDYFMDALAKRGFTAIGKGY